MQRHSNWQDELFLCIKDYRPVFDVTQAELQAFPLFIRYKALNMYLMHRNIL